MSALQQQHCPACGAPVAIPAGATQMDCPFCHTGLTVDMSGSRGALHVATEVASAIRQSDAETRAVLERMELRQQRAVALQEGEIIRGQLDRINAAVTAMRSRWLNNQERAQLQSLLAQGNVLVARRDRLRAEIADIDRRLAPPAAAYAPPPPPPPPAKLPPPRRRPVRWPFAIFGAAAGLILALIALTPIVVIASDSVVVGWIVVLLVIGGTILGGMFGYSPGGFIRRVRRSRGRVTGRAAPTAPEVGPSGAP